MHSIRYRFVVVSALSLGVIHFSGCGASGLPDSGEALDSWQAALTSSEKFESGSKGAYAAGNVTLGSGVWNMNDALLGNLSTDVKDGAQAARVRNNGRVTMQFDRTTGAGTVSIQHATYGSDSNGSWGLFLSQDHGSSWSQVGSSITTSPSVLHDATFNVNRAGTIRFDLRKLDGGSNRIDFDDISITDFSAGMSDGGTNPPGASVSVHTTLGIPSPS